MPVAALCIVAAALLSGCRGRDRVELVSTQQIQIAEQTPQAERLWQSIQQTLRDHRFRLDRIDRAAGVITTFPIGSEHFFEFWRHDVDTRRDWLEATINPLRRWVSVTLTPGGEAGWEQIAVAVHKERLSATERQFNNSAAVYQFYSEQLPATTGEMQPGKSEEKWLDIGRDPAMEDRLLSMMLEEAGASVAAPSSEPEGSIDEQANSGT